MWKDFGLRSFLNFWSSSSCVWVHLALSFINTRCWWLTSPYLQLHLDLRVWTPAHQHLHRLPEGISTFLSGSHIFGQVLWEGGGREGSLLGPPSGSKPIGVRWHMIRQMERLSCGALTAKAQTVPWKLWSRMSLQRLILSHAHKHQPYYSMLLCQAYNSVLSIFS